MCATCGCGQAEVTLDGVPLDHDHDHDHGHDHGHDHAHAHDHPLLRPLPQSAAAAPFGPGQGQGLLIKVEQDLLAANDAVAARTRARLADRRILALNLVSSPGSGKTSLLVRTVQLLAGRVPVAVIEGDQQTSNDAERIRATGAPAVQINTGKGCHLDARMVADAVTKLDPPAGAVLMIENVGNLVCPAGFDLGEAAKVVVLSVTEGEDKPLKYPDMFAAASLMLLNKVDLLPYLRFDVEACLANARRVNPEIAILEVSATTDQGLDAWIAWIDARRART